MKKMSLDISFYMSLDMSLNMSLDMSLANRP